MKVLVTGGSGLVGRFVVDELARNHEISILDVRPPHRPDLSFHHIDVLRPDALGPCVRNCEAVVHLAGIPHPLNHPPDQVFHTNAVGTLNILEASVRAGVRKFILMSSESTLGFAFSTTRLWPEYVPIDERHPTKPQDAYGLSKLSCELLCAGYSAKSPMQTICLRAPWIWCPQEGEIAFYKDLVRNYAKWYKNLWAWIHVGDVAKAIALALEADDLPAHEVMFICATENWTGRDSRSLLAEYYPETQDIAPSLKGAQSIISFAKAQRLLGFEPRYSTTDILGNQSPEKSDSA